MTRESGTIRERIYKALVARYTAEQEDALVKIDALLRGDVVPGHVDLTEDIDKLLSKVAEAAEKMATLRQHYGTNQAKSSTILPHKTNVWNFPGTKFFMLYKDYNQKQVKSSTFLQPFFRIEECLF